MSNVEGKELSRREVLKGAVALAGLASTEFVTLHKAWAKTPKAALPYQDHPHGKQACESCVQFVPGATRSTMGTCKVVAGAIRPHGWCLAYAPKS